MEFIPFTTSRQGHHLTISCYLECFNRLILVITSVMSPTYLCRHCLLFLKAYYCHPVNQSKLPQELSPFLQLSFLCAWKIPYFIHFTVCLSRASFGETALLLCFVVYLRSRFRADLVWFVGRFWHVRHNILFQRFHATFDLFVLSRLDYCYLLFLGFHIFLLDKLKRAQNNAIIYSSIKANWHFTHELHLLPFKSLFDYKVATPSCCCPSWSWSRDTCLRWWIPTSLSSAHADLLHALPVYVNFWGHLFVSVCDLSTGATSEVFKASLKTSFLNTWRSPILPTISFTFLFAFVVCSVTVFVSRALSTCCQM